MKRFLAVLLVPVALLAACGSDDDDTAAEGGSSTTAAASADDFNDADVEFAQGMIPHHEQAVEMADLATDRAEAAEVKDLAGRIRAAQDPEIETMTDWLEQWDEPAESDSGMGMGHGGAESNGMMSDDEMTELEDASGAEFDQMFLEMMKEHHEGAINMAETELEEGESRDALDLAQMIVDTQTAEVNEIDGLLAKG